MRTDRLARSYLDRARERLFAARSAQERKVYPEAVRFSQECVEMSLKAVLRSVGIEHPKSHDVGEFVVYKRRSIPDVVQRRDPRPCSNLD